jgi:hypothetical protein
MAPATSSKNTDSKNSKNVDIYITPTMTSSSTGTSLPRPTSLLTSSQFSQLLGGEGAGRSGSLSGNNTTTSSNFNEDIEVTATDLTTLTTDILLQRGNDNMEDLFHIPSNTPSTTTSCHVPQRPRRVWSIQDTAIKPVPSYYPPFDPNCFCLVTDVPPSLVVIRISECLRKRSIAAEYDDEQVRATCLTVDRTSFCIQLYKGGSGSGSGSHSGGTSDHHANVAAADAAAVVMANQAPGAVIVECQRLTGSVTSFHKACRAILKAAKGLESGAIIGDDETESELGSSGTRGDVTLLRRHGGNIDNLTNGLEFQSLKRRRLPIVGGQEQRYHPIHPVLVVQDTIETVQDFLRKDRLECQQLGMERLVNITTCEISGEEIATEASRQIIENPEFLLDLIVHPEAKKATVAYVEGISNSTNKRLNKKQTRNIRGRDVDDDENVNTTLIRSFLESSVAVTPPSKHKGVGGGSSSNEGEGFLWNKQNDQDDETKNVNVPNLSPDEFKHEARLHSMALRVLCNALYNLSKVDQLQSILYRDSLCGAITNAGSSSQHQVGGGNPLVQPPVLLSLVQDLMGASRPQSVAGTGYRLTSVHEAALAVRCLRLLAGEGEDMDNDNVEETSSPFSKVRDLLLSDPVLERLELARACGRSIHLVLQQEADRTYKVLTEDVRSC